MGFLSAPTKKEVLENKSEATNVFCSFLIANREIKGFTQSHVAKCLRVSRSYYQRIESGKSTPSLYQTILLFHLLNFTACDYEDMASQILDINLVL